MWTLSTTTKNYISEKEKKYSFSTRTRTTSTFTTTLPGKTLTYPASIWTRRKPVDGNHQQWCLLPVGRQTTLSAHHERKHSQHLRRLIQRTVDWQLGGRALPYPHKRHYRQLPPRPEESEQYMFRFCQKPAVKIIWEIYGSELSTA